MEAFKTYFVEPIKNHYVDFGGRATRTQYWAFVGFNIVLALIVTALALILGKIAGALGTIVMILWYLFQLGILLPSLGIAARRLRDGGFSPWLLLLNLVPFVGGIIVLVLLLLPSKDN